MKQSIRWAVVAMGFLPLLAGKKAHSSGVVTAKVGKQLIQTDHANASIGNASLQNTSVNLMKKEAIVGFEGTTGPLGFEMILGGSTACRGSSPTDIESTYYTIATTNLDGCRTRCQRDVTCTGIGQPNANTCGNWKVPIEATTFGHGDICYVAHRRVLGQSSFASRIATGYLVFTHMDWGNVNTEFFTDLASATARFAELDGGAKAAGMYEADFTELKFYGSQKDAIVKDFYKTFTSTKLLPEAKAGSSPVEGFNGMLGNKLSTLLHGGKVAWEQTGLAAATFFGRGLAGMANGASPFLGPVASISSTLLDNLMSKSQENDYIFQTSPFLLKTVKEMVGMKDVEGGPLGSINGRVAAALKGFSSKLGLASSVAPVGGNVRLSQSMLLEAEATELQARLLEKCYSAAYSCYSAEGQGDHMKSQANSIAWSSCDRIQEECKTNMNAGIAFVLQEVAASHFATIADLLSLMPQGSITDEVLVDTFNAVGCPNPAPDTTNWKDTLDAVPDNAKVLQEMFNLCEQTALGTASEEDKKQCCVTSCTPVCVKQTGFFYRGQAAVESLLHKLKKIRGEYRSALTRARYHHLAKRISQVACGADRKCREIDGVSEFTTLPDSISNTDGVSMLGHPNVRIFKKGLTQQVLTKLQKGDNLVNDRVVLADERAIFSTAGWSHRDILAFKELAVRFQNPGGLTPFFGVWAHEAVEFFGPSYAGTVYEVVAQGSQGLIIMYPPGADCGNVNDVACGKWLENSDRYSWQWGDLPKHGWFVGDKIYFPQDVFHTVPHSQKFLTVLSDSTHNLYKDPKTEGMWFGFSQKEANDLFGQTLPASVVKNVWANGVRGDVEMWLDNGACDPMGGETKACGRWKDTKAQASGNWKLGDRIYLPDEEPMSLTRTFFSPISGRGRISFITRNTPERSGTTSVTVNGNEIKAVLKAQQTGDATTCSDRVGAGWQLVRRSTGKSFPYTDQLEGSAPASGTPHRDPLGAAFTKRWNANSGNEDFDEFLFATGDCQKWMVMKKPQVIGANNWYHHNEPRQILKSHTSDVPYEAVMVRRGGHGEDPWVSFRGHYHHDEAKGHTNDRHCDVLYVGNNADPWCTTGDLGDLHEGLNVFTRKSQAVPTGDATTCSDKVGADWQLVRRSTGKSFPERDFLEGSAPAAGTPHRDPKGGAFTKQWNANSGNEDFDEFLFATGDCQKWMVMKKTQVIGADNWYHHHEPRQILKSHISDVPYDAVMVRRSGSPEDPWISFRGHYHHDEAKGHTNDRHCDVLYIGGSVDPWCTSGDLGDLHEGLNVFIRKSQASPGDTTSDEFPVTLDFDVQEGNQVLTVDQPILRSFYFEVTKADSGEQAVTLPRPDNARDLFTSNCYRRLSYMRCAGDAGKISVYPNTQDWVLKFYMRMNKEKKMMADGHFYGPSFDIFNSVGTHNYFDIGVHGNIVAAGPLFTKEAHGHGKPEISIAKTPWTRGQWHRWEIAFQDGLFIVLMDGEVISSYSVTLPYVHTFVIRAGKNEVDVSDLSITQDIFTLKADAITSDGRSFGTELATANYPVSGLRSLSSGGARRDFMTQCRKGQAIWRGSMSLWMQAAPRFEELKGTAIYGHRTVHANNDFQKDDVLTTGVLCP